MTGRRPVLPAISSVLVMDLVDLPAVRRCMGQATGERLHGAIASRLRAQLRHPDWVVPLGGDRFAVTVGEADDAVALRVAERLVLAVEEPFPLDGANIRLTACVGVSKVLEGEVEVAMRCAEEALVHAVADGPGIVRSHAGQVGATSVSRLLRRAELRTAFASGGDAFVLHYQPVVDLASGSVQSLEALVRWEHQGILWYPGEFLTDLRHAGLMQDLTHLVLLRSLSEMRAHGIAVPVAINVAAGGLNAWLLDEVRDACAATGASPADVMVEITEDAIACDPESARAVLAELRASGTRVTLDNFGTRLSGRSLLSSLPLDSVKVDRSVSSRVAYDPDALSAMQAIATECASLGLVAVAEGAEDRATLTVLEQLGFRSVQGYVVTRPMPVAELIAWLDARTREPIARSES